MHRARSLVVLAALTFAASSNIFAATSFSKTSYPTGNGPLSVASADINRDGNPDLIVVNRGSGSNFITVLLGTSSGAFTVGSNIATAASPLEVVVGDFNNDGYPDVAVLEDTGFQIFLSAHNGTLTPMALQTIPATGIDIIAVDLNGNHVPDVALTRCAQGGCSLETWVNDGTAHFTEKQGIAMTRTLPYSLVSADFDRDGHDDIAVADNTAVKIYHSNNNGTLTLHQTITPVGNIGTFGLAAGDIDVANGPDLIFEAGDACGPDCNFASTLYEYLNNGSGTLGLKNSYELGANSGNNNYLIDLTGDNRLDIVHVREAVQDNSGELDWAHYTSNGNYSSFSVLEAMNDPRGLVGRDFNHDSWHDLAVADMGSPGLGTPATVVFLNHNDTAYCPPPSSANLAAKICSPTSSPSSSKFTVTAVGNSPTGVRRLELWVDGKKLYNSPDDRLEDTITLAAGSHTLTIVAVDQFRQTAKTSITVTVP